MNLGKIQCQKGKIVSRLKHFRVSITLNKLNFSECATEEKLQNADDSPTDESLRCLFNESSTGTEFLCCCSATTVAQLVGQRVLGNVSLRRESWEFMFHSVRWLLNSCSSHCNHSTSSQHKYFMLFYVFGESAGSKKEWWKVKTFPASNKFRNSTNGMCSEQSLERL